MRRFALLTLVVVCALATAGAGLARPERAAMPAPSGTLTIVNETGGNWTCGFNPFNLGDMSQSLGTVYEPLAFVNTLHSGKAAPWLAQRWWWSHSNRVLTFTIRRGVRFSDGTPMTAADVVYTFDLLRRHPVLDINKIWSALASVKREGSRHVVMRFRRPSVPSFFAIADQVAIVPRAVWSKVADPVRYADANPIGTGPYRVSARTCTPQNIAYHANRAYWRPGEPKIGTVNYPAFLTNDTANAFLAAGQGQWGGQFIPDIQQFYVRPNPRTHHYWLPPVANTSLFINLTNPVLKYVAVRRAMAYAINRARVSRLAEFGEEPPSNQTGIVTPTFSGWLDRQQAAAYGHDYAYDPARAIRILRAAGFRRGPDGIFAKGKQRLAFTLINQGGFSDWVAAGLLIASDLRRVGIAVQVINLSFTTYQQRLDDGQFQLGYGVESGGPGPYYELRQLLFSPDSARVGQPAASDFERYRNAMTDSLINAYAATTNPVRQRRIVAMLEKVMLADVPVIPVTESVNWYEYNTQSITGWPTPGNSYAQPGPYISPDWGQVLLRLRPKRP